MTRSHCESQAERNDGSPHFFPMTFWILNDKNAKNDFFASFNAQTPNLPKEDKGSDKKLDNY